MKQKYPIIRVLLIAFSTLMLSLLGIVLLLGDVRQELLRMIKTSATLPRTLQVPPGVWYGFLALGLLGVGFLFVRQIVSFSIPHLHKAYQCPKCDARLQRVHRKKSERWLSTILLLHVGRYGCINCEWSGLRRHNRHRDE